MARKSRKFRNIKRINNRRIKTLTRHHRKDFGSMYLDEAISLSEKNSFNISNFLFSF